MKAMTYDEMQQVEGGIVEYVDAGCAGVAIWGVLGGPLGWGLEIFCAGWAVGRVIDELGG